VFGGGPIGNMAGQWLRFAGAARVFIVDVDDRKLALARSMGFEPLDAGAGDPVEALRGRTGGAGVDAALEAVGLPLTYRQVLAAVRHSGQSVLMGNIRGTWNSRFAPEGANDWTESRARLGRGIDVAPLVSHVVPLAEGPAVFRRIIGGGEYFAKVVFTQ
jgi:threonine dehydrogenase-like Zn-dependent dehydrogenase